MLPALEVFNISKLVSILFDLRALYFESSGSILCYPYLFSNEPFVTPSRVLPWSVLMNMILFKAERYVFSWSTKTTVTGSGNTIATVKQMLYAGERGRVTN